MNVHIAAWRYGSMLPDLKDILWSAADQGYGLT